MASSGDDMPAPPAGCTTRDALEKRHTNEKAYLDSRLAAANKPRLGSKPIASASVQLQVAAEREQLAVRHRGEIEQLEKYLEYVHLHPIEGAPKASPESAEAGAGSSTAATDGGKAATTSVDDAVDTSGKSRAQVRRDKKRAEASASSTTIDESDGKSKKELEMEDISKQLQPLGLGVKLIASDGHCLFRAVSDQLKSIRGSDAGAFCDDYVELRKRASDYIRLHPTDFAPFLPYEDGDGFEGATTPAAVRAAVDKYCARLAGTAMWGGHPEIRALACTLGVPITVYQAGAKPWVMAPESERIDKTAPGTFAGVSMRLSYHKHFYALGEHYNSVVAAPTRSALST